jgi:hypothetical protein
MFASGLLRDRRDLQQQMRKDALCFACNRNNTVETSTVGKQASPTVQPPEGTTNTTPTVVARSSLLNKKLVPPNE